METSDKQFFLTFLAVTGVLVVITIVVLVAASFLGGMAGTGEKSAAQIRIAKERIEPIGKVNLKSDPVESIETTSTTIVAVNQQAAPPSASLAVKNPGEKIYNGICQSCHLSGVAGAPIVGHTEDWSERIATGMEALYSSAINGKGIMPPKGGNPNLTDANVKSAVDYMVNASR